MKEIKKQLIKSTYPCDKCGKEGDHTDMVYLGPGKLYHGKCAKQTNQ